MESAANIFLSYSTNPLLVSEAVLDHDYTLQSMRRCGDSTKDMWNGLISTVKKMENLIAEPIRAFMHEDLRTFKVLDWLPLKLVRMWLLPRYRRSVATSSRHRNSTTICWPDTRRNRNRRSLLH